MKKTTITTLLLGFMFVLHTGFSSKANLKDEIPITTNSEEARKLFLEGRELLDDIRSDEARELFQKAIDQDPDFAQAHLSRAFTSISNADFQEHFEKAVALAPNASEGERLMIEAVRANIDNNPVKAVELYEQLVEKFPNDKRAWQALGQVYSGQDKDNMAIAQYIKAIEIDKNFASAYNSLGYAYIQKKEFENSEEAFKNYIRLIPDKANPHDSIADLYTIMGRHEDAIEHFKKAVELNPKFVMSQRKIGTNLVFTGKYDEGRDAYRKAMEMKSTPNAKVTDMNEIAGSYIYEGNFKKALAAFDESIKMAQKAGLSFRIAGIHSQKCYVHLESGYLAKAEESLAECNKILEASDIRQSFKENFAKNALVQEALIAAKRGDIETAMAKADEHLAKIQSGNNPNEVEDHHNLIGLIQFEKGDHSKAIEHLSQGDQEDPYILYYIAVSEEKAGNKTRATELFKNVAERNDNSLAYAFVRSKAIDAQKMAGKK